MIRPKGKRFTGFVFEVLRRAKGPVPLVTVKDRVQRYYYVRVMGQDVIDGVGELERQGRVTTDQEHGRFFSTIHAQVSPLYRLAAL